MSEMKNLSGSRRFLGASQQRDGVAGFLRRNAIGKRDRRRAPQNPCRRVGFACAARRSDTGSLVQQQAEHREKKMVPGRHQRIPWLLNLRQMSGEGARRLPLISSRRSLDVP